MWHSEFKLYLYPDDPKYIIDLKKILYLLQSLKFTEKIISSNRYSTGDNFVSLLTFMGCSPNIELEPQKEKPYCYIEAESHQQAQFISGKNTKYPACPHCKDTLKKTTCSNCNKEIDPAQFNWRKSAFFASGWITIGNIYELEAVPNDQLLNALKRETGVNWKHAYIRQDKK